MSSLTFKRSKKYFLLILFFFWMFTPSLNLGVTNLNTNIFFIVLPSFLGAFLYFRKGMGSKLINMTFISMILSFIIVLAYTSFGLINNIVDYYIPKTVLMGFFILFSAYFIVKIHKDIYEENFVAILLRNLFYIGVIHSIIILLTALSSVFSDTLYQIVNLTDKQQKYISSDVIIKRYSGLLETGFSSLSVTHGLLLVSGIIFYWKYDNNFSLSRTCWFLTLFSLIFLSLIMTGRSGLIIFLFFAISLIVYLFLELFIKMIINKKMFNLFLLLSFLSIAILIFFDFSDYKNQIDTSFEIFISFINTGEFRSASTDQLLENELLFPSGMELMFGSGNFGLGSSRIASDIGFVYLVNGMGILGTFIVFIPYLLPIYFANQNRKYSLFLFLYMLFVVLILIPLNFKDLYFLGFAGHTKIFFILICTYHFIILERKKYQK
tara:strand:+ start:28818 stop:30125 length:1308 start_codon:yes stop_codon:yes gene_type:complete